MSSTAPICGSSLTLRRCSRMRVRREHKHLGIMKSELDAWTVPDSGIRNWQLCWLPLSEKPAIPNHPGIYSLLIQSGIAHHPACQSHHWPSMLMQRSASHPRLTLARIMRRNSEFTAHEYSRSLTKMHCPLLNERVGSAEVVKVILLNHFSGLLS